MGYRQAILKAAEGRHPWGTIEVPDYMELGHTGWGRYRLAVLPPGTNAAERRALMFCRLWPLWGALVSLAAGFIAGGLGSMAAMVVIAAVYAVGLIVGLVATSRIRKRVRWATAVVMTTGEGLEAYGDIRLFESCVSALDELDLRMSGGELTPIEYELGWAAVYNALEEQDSAAAPGLLKPTRHR